MCQIVDGIAIDVKQPQGRPPSFRRFLQILWSLLVVTRDDLRPQEVEVKRLLDQKDSEQR